MKAERQERPQNLSGLWINVDVVTEQVFRVVLNLQLFQLLVNFAGLFLVRNHSVFRNLFIGILHPLLHGFVHALVMYGPDKTQEVSVQGKGSKIS